MNGEGVSQGMNEEPRKENRGQLSQENREYEIAERQRKKYEEK